MQTGSQAKVSRVLKCPRCGQLTRYDQSNLSRPFCSERCKNGDIVDWAEGRFGIPGTPVELHDDQDDW